MNDRPEINPVREHAVSVVKDPKATQHQKLDALLHLMLDNAVTFESEMKELREDVNANPFAWIPTKQWRKRIAAGLLAWFAWVTVNLFGVEVTLADIWKKITELL